MIEYLIQSVDGSWFEFEDGTNPFVTTSIPFEDASTDEELAISIEGCRISFSFEDIGVQVVFEGLVDEALAAKVVSEIASNIEVVTGKKAKFLRYA